MLLLLRAFQLIFLVLLKVSGQEDRFVWTKLEGTIGYERGQAVAVDTSTGDVYVTGSTEGSLHGEPYLENGDIFLIKYTSNGTRVWTRMVGSVGIEVGCGVSVDSTTESVYVTGYADGSLHAEPYAGAYDIFLLKYASNGTRLWTRMVGTIDWDEGRGVSVDTITGDVYVTGSTSGSLHEEPYGGSNDIILMKFASNGTRVWTKMVGTSGADNGYGVSVNPTTSDVYLVGRVRFALHGEPYAGSFDIILMKYASNGTRLWTRMAGTSRGDQGRGVSVDTSTGAVYATGYSGRLYGEPYEGLNDIFLMKYASDGTRLWTRMAGTTGNDYGNGVVVDTSTGAVYVTGSAEGSLHGQPYVGDNDIFLMKYSSNGHRVWTQMMGTTGFDSGYSVATNPNTELVFFTGEVQGSLHGQPHAGAWDIATICYNISLAFELPTSQPTSQPSGQPFVIPTSQPTQPSGQPTSLPSQPSGQPTNQPSQPSGEPTGRPTGQPTCRPTSQPSVPTGQPTNQPSSYPTGQPSCTPTGVPTGQPTEGPTGQPTGQPSVPTTLPSPHSTGQPTEAPQRTDGTMVCKRRTYWDVKYQTEYTSHRCYKNASL